MSSLQENFTFDTHPRIRSQLYIQLSTQTTVNDNNELLEEEAYVMTIWSSASSPSSSFIYQLTQSIVLRVVLLDRINYWQK